MGIDDKAKHEAEDLGGKVKEGWGRLTDDEQLEAEGKVDQAKADIKKAKDAAVDKVDDTTERLLP